MARSLIGVFLIAAFVTGGFAAQTTVTTKKRASTSSKAKKSSKKTSKSTAATSTVKPTSKTKSLKKRTPAAPPRRSSQLQPTAGRYKEIQQALADKGYFAGSPDGNWGPDSVDALKRFQRDQSLTEDGKIGSLSLIALGLGPQRVAAAAPTPPAQ